MSHQTQAPPSLQRDCRGAVMIMAVFMAMIAIGALYFLVGLGDAMLAQERMQDAADATAFSSAVIHARGMNILALINIIMAAVLAIAVLLSILGSVLKAGAIAATVASIFSFGGTAGLAKALYSEAKFVDKTREKVETTVNTVLRIGHGLQATVSTAIPMIAGLNAYTLSSQSYGPVVSGGTTFPIYGSLPTVDGDFDKLCEKAGSYAGAMAIFPIAAILESFGGDWLADKLKSLADKAAVTYANYYCGDGKMPDAPTVTVDVALPELVCTERSDCERDRGSDACTAYAELKEEVAARYDVESTSCSSPDNNKYCLQNRRRAREQCLPTNRPKVKNTRWVKREAEHFYRIEGTGENRRVVKDVRDAPDGTKRPDGIQRGNGVLMDGKTFKTAASIPCRLPGGSFQKVGNFGRFIVTNFTEWEFDPALPLCTEEFEPPTLADFGGSDTMSINVIEVADIISCEIEKEFDSPLPKGKLTEKMKKNTPQEMCNCAALGEDMFQIRSVVFGDAKEYTAKSDSRILVATLGEKAPSTTIGQIASLVGRMAAAQAEYYFEWPDDPKVQANPSEWLWHMGWKARMRRLRLSGKAWECPEKKNTCERKVGKLGKLVGDQVLKANALTKLLKEGADAVIVH